ncbi:hypothetical protein [Sphingobacterium multivorum]|uniref:hypothetical protein n=1 Tax=Sphingobacterium multivorum TaxID=28454 RepID=UPI00345E6267
MEKLDITIGILAWKGQKKLINVIYSYKKKFYLEVTKDFVGETIDLEQKIAFWWPRQNFKVAHGEGPFKHEDLIKYSLFKRLKIRIFTLLSRLKK